MAYVFLEHPSSLEHDTRAYGAGGSIIVHPEHARRIIAIERELSARGWFGFERVRAPAVDRSVLTLVHPEPYVASIERACGSGGAFLDIDTVVSQRSFEAALHAAGGAVRMVDLLLDGQAWAAFSSHRPPGHHALRSQAMGFCLFNNIAVAASWPAARPRPTAHKPPSGPGGSSRAARVPRAGRRAGVPAARFADARRRRDWKRSS